MSEIKFSNFINEDGSNGPDLVGVTTFTSPYYFVPPSGTTAQRPSGDGLAPGMLRFNTDIGRLEVWRGDHWATILGESPNLGISTAAAPASSGTGARGVWGGGYTPTLTSSIRYLSISSLGNTQSFGSLTEARGAGSACSSSTRGLFNGGNTPTTLSSNMNYITISSTGSGISFGDLVSGATRYTAACSSSTRGLIGGGQAAGYAYKNNIDYVTIATTGNSVNFGSLSYTSNYGSSFSSSVRGIFTGGYNDPIGNRIDFVTISTQGNSIYFGDLTVKKYGSSGCSNATRGLFGSGIYPSPVSVIYNIIDFITISTTGNAQDFGDLTSARWHTGQNTAASPTRGLFCGGYTAPSSPYGTVNVIDYVTIASTGNAVDFGDVGTGVLASSSGLSNAHGGL